MNCHRSLLVKLCFLFTKLPLGHNIQIHELERLQEYNFDKKIIITVAYLKREQRESQARIHHALTKAKGTLFWKRYLVI